MRSPRQDGPASHLRNGGTILTRTSFDLFTSCEFPLELLISC